MVGFSDVFKGKRILIVEDDYLIATEASCMLREQGAAVVGPVATVREALDFIEDDGVDAALLDIELGPEDSFPIADRLLARQIPFVFVSAMMAGEVPATYRGYLIDKPASLNSIARGLFASELN